MSYIELDKHKVIKACKSALDIIDQDVKKTFDIYYADGLKKKTFWTRTPYTPEQAKQYADNQMYDDYVQMFASWKQLDINAIMRSAECSDGTIHLTDKEVGRISKFLKDQ